MKTTIVTPEEARAIAREAYIYGFPWLKPIRRFINRRLTRPARNTRRR